MRNRRVRRVLQSTLRALCWVLLRLLPTRRHVVVHGWPDDEGNALEVVRALGRRYRGTVYWLLDDPVCPGPLHARGDLGDPRIRRVRKNSLASAVVALTAGVTFFTHGLFTAVRPPRSRLVVNLWHGDGPKMAKDTHLVRSTVVVAGTRLWGAQRTQRFHLPPEAVAVVGNPRIDQFTAASREDVLNRLGLDPHRRTVLWLPTYRAASAPHRRTWSTASSLSTTPSVAPIVQAFGEAAQANGLQMVVKPHPLDADNYDGLGLQLVRHQDLSAAGVTLYQVLGAADAIVSDVSSVWPDFLALDRPIGFYVPDLEQLQDGGWLNVEDLGSLLPGVRIETPEEARSFLETVTQDPDRLRPSRYPATERIGPTQPGGVADRLLDWLDNFQRARGEKAHFEDVRTS